MIKTTLLCGAVLTAIPFLAPAKDFPLEFKTLNAAEAMALPRRLGHLGIPATQQTRRHHQGAAGGFPASALRPVVLRREEPAVVPGG